MRMNKDRMRLCQCQRNIWKWSENNQCWATK